MDGDAEAGVYFTPETLEQYFRAPAPSVYTLSGAPECLLVIEPESQMLRLRTPATDYPADVGHYDRLSFDLIEEPGHDGVWFELSISADGMPYEAYSLIMSVVDQLGAGQPFKHSVAEALAAYKELLTRRRGLSDEQEIGLFGELGVFSYLLDSVGEEASIASWLGPQNEEHDFVLPDADVEVKTTRTEARVHMIGSASQLAASPGRPLFLVSIQVTAAGNADGGRTLAERVGEVRGRLHRSRRVFDERLRALGWDDLHAEDVYTHRYMARSVSRAYLVDGSFPAITREGLERIVTAPELITSLAYRIDVTGLRHVDPPVALVGYCEGRNV